MCSWWSLTRRKHCFVFKTTGCIYDSKSVRSVLTWCCRTQRNDDLIIKKLCNQNLEHALCKTINLMTLTTFWAFIKIDFSGISHWLKPISLSTFFCRSNINCSKKKMLLCFWGDWKSCLILFVLFTSQPKRFFLVSTFWMLVSRFNCLCSRLFPTWVGWMYRYVSSLFFPLFFRLFYFCYCCLHYFFPLYTSVWWPD